MKYVSICMRLTAYAHLALLQPTLTPVSAQSLLPDDANFQENYLPIFRKERRDNKATEALSWGGQLKAFPIVRHNMNFDDVKGLDQSFIPLRLEMGMGVKVSQQADFYFSLELKDKILLKNGSSDSTELNIDNARLNLHDFGIKGLSLHLGRMTIQDKREAILRTQYDGGLLSYEQKRFQLDIGVFSRGDINHDILHDDPTLKSTDILARLETRITNRFIVGGYMLTMNDRTNTNDDRQYYAIRSHGRLWPGFVHRAEITHLKGETGSGRRKAWSVELRGLQKTNLPGRAEIGLAYIWASGDDDSSDGIDTLFRQTGLQRNNSFWDKGPKYRLLGEAIRAEVANIQALTAMVRFFPSKKSSLALLVHNFKQDKASPQQPGWRWGTPNGIDKHLATEIDLNGSYKFKNGTALEVNFAFVRPGKAIGASRKNGFAYGLELRHPL